MPKAGRYYTLSAPITEEEYYRVDALWRTSPFKLKGEFCRFLVRNGLASYAAKSGLGDVADVLERASTRGAGSGLYSDGAEPPLLLPPPASASEPTAPTLSELAALIRKTAETNPFVRPLADFLEGRI